MIIGLKISTKNKHIFIFNDDQLLVFVLIHLTKIKSIDKKHTIMQEDRSSRVWMIGHWIANTQCVKLLKEKNMYPKWCFIGLFYHRVWNPCDYNIKTLRMNASSTRITKSLSDKLLLLLLLLLLLPRHHSPNPLVKLHSDSIKTPHTTINGHKQSKKWDLLLPLLK